LLTGLGKAGTPFSNCAISGTNGTDDMAGFLPIGQIPGETIGTAKGNSTNTITLTVSQLPQNNIDFALDRKGGNAGINVISGNTPGSGPYGKKPINFGGSGAAINIANKSKVQMYFVAITDPE
jgi:hypothetical protein